MKKLQPDEIIPLSNNTIHFNFVEFKAADLDKNELITMDDYSKLKNFLLGDIDTLNSSD